MPQLCATLYYSRHAGAYYNIPSHPTLILAAVVRGEEDPTSSHVP